ncbi:unnamed protein product [Tuber aestivum]|uniref:Gfd2/YDR514C-like C-terminal domain-containing protein n=1 Tax=Tuber aestivum TaxID=59557 RepID=A0A292PWY9_9PEZI|nr:unnamed protein product [Tuber aestivum]
MGILFTKYHVPMGLTLLRRGVCPHFLPSCGKTRGTYCSTQSRPQEPVPRQPRPLKQPPALHPTPRPQPPTACRDFSHSTGALKSAKRKHPSKIPKPHKPKPRSAPSKATKTKIRMDNFVEYKTLRAFPYKFLSRADQHVVSRFFDSKPFHAYGWRIYSYETPVSGTLLIPWVQVDQFFREVAAETNIRLLQNFPLEKISYTLDSMDDVPILMGEFGSKAELDEALQTSGASVRKASAKKNSKSKRNAAKRLQAMETWKSQVESARNHLGYTQQASGHEVEKTFPVFVSIDVEAFEHNHNVITEVGIAILDTTKIPPPQENAAGRETILKAIQDSFGLSNAPLRRSDAIISIIKTHHFRVSEHRNMRNGQFVTDAADLFMFGDSEFVSLEKLPKRIGECFRHYDNYGEKRRVVLVGHDVKTDVDFLMAVGYDVSNISGLEVIDTTCMWKAVMSDHQSKGLGPMLYDLGVDFRHLHNAGNDAAYTLQALVKLAEIGLLKGGEDGASAKPSPNLYRPIWQKAENVQIGFADEADNRQANTLPPTKPVPREIEEAGDNSEGSSLSMSGDGWD